MFVLVITEANYGAHGPGEGAYRHGFGRVPRFRGLVDQRVYKSIQSADIQEKLEYWGIGVF